MIEKFDDMVFKGFPDMSIKNQVLCILRRVGFSLNRKSMTFDTDENNIDNRNYLIVFKSTGKYEFITKEEYDDVYDDSYFSTLSYYSLVDLCQYLKVNYLIDVKELEVSKLVKNNDYITLHNKMCNLSNLMNKLKSDNEHLLYGVLLGKFGSNAKVIHNTLVQIVYSFSSFTPLTSYNQTNNFLLTLCHYYLNNFNTFLWDKTEGAEPTRWQNAMPEIDYDHEDLDLVNDECLKCLACILTGKDISYFNDSIVRYVVNHLTETIDYLNKPDTMK